MKWKNSKYKNSIKTLIISVFILSSIFAINIGKDTNVNATINSIKSNMPQVVKFSTQVKAYNRVFFDGFYVDVERIQADVGVAYCLELDKDYPNGENFIIEGEPSELTKKLLAVGYPNKTVEELGLSNEDEAYLATQVAMWSILEGYNPNTIRAESEEVTKAIKMLVEKSIDADLEELMKDVKQYYYSEDIQRVALVLDRVPVIPPPPENEGGSVK